jgi:hypothetical protein
MTNILIDLGDDTSRPLTPTPEALGAGFAAIVAEAASWSIERRREVNDQYDARDYSDAYLDATERIDEALGVNGSGIGIWPCTFGGKGEPDWAGPYIETVGDEISFGAGEVAAAVIARDFGLVTEANFQIVTAWWVAAGLPLPPARNGAHFAADETEVKDNAGDLRSNEHRIVGWPLAAVHTPPEG